ncbi:MAG: HNH endonuclease family protein [Cytophagales bacterium]|nr:HNH endonuclease family protein [Cytophagales bacterium]
MQDYTDSFWGGHREIKKRIKELTLFNEKQAYPILIAAYNSLSQEDFAKVLKLVATITFRYTVIGKLHTNLKEDIYNKAAIRISNKEITTIAQIAASIRPLYPNDKDFKNDFASKSISTKRGKKLVRYILFSLENHLSHSDYDFEENPGTIEHILPENGHENYLAEFPQAIQESVVYRLGNYTLLEEDKNRACKALSFEAKREIFATSQYLLSQRINSNTWSPNSIDLRQERLANCASSIWRISQYDS